MRDIPLEWIAGRFAVWRADSVSDKASIETLSGSFVSITRTPEEWSVVSQESDVPADVTSEQGWVGLRAAGTLSFDMVGVLARILAPLAEANISVFVVSTHATDYVLVKEELAGRAHEALSAATGLQVTNAPSGAS